MSLWHKFAPLAALLAMVMLSGASGPSRASTAKLMPWVTLWAWERPEDLRFLDPDNVGVAFLAGSVYLDQQPVVRPRLQPLRVGEHTPVTAVVRLENTKSTPAAFPDEYRHRLADQIVGLSAASQVSALQIDFDATHSTGLLSLADQRRAGAASCVHAAIHYRAELVVHGRRLAERAAHC